MKNTLWRAVFRLYSVFHVWKSTFTFVTKLSQFFFNLPPALRLHYASTLLPEEVTPNKRTLNLWAESWSLLQNSYQITLKVLEGQFWRGIWTCTCLHVCMHTRACISAFNARKNFVSSEKPTVLFTQQWEVCNVLHFIFCLGFQEAQSSHDIYFGWFLFYFAANYFHFGSRRKM